MGSSNAPRRRTRVERGIYRQANGKYAVCVMVDGRARFRTLDAATLDDARRQRQALQSVGRICELPLSPRLTFAEVANRWLAEFEAKVAAGRRRERTLDLYRSQLRRHLLPRLGRRRLRSITPDDVVAVVCELQTAGLCVLLLTRALEPRLLASEDLHSTRAAAPLPRPVPPAPRRQRRCGPHKPLPGRVYLTKT